MSVADRKSRDLTRSMSTARVDAGELAFESRAELPFRGTGFRVYTDACSRQSFDSQTCKQGSLNQ